MKIERVVYGRLFSLGDYHNEKINLQAIVEEGEEPDSVLGALFFKILNMEECLEAYRTIQARLDLVSQSQRRTASSIQNQERNLQDMKVNLSELEAQLKAGGEIDEKLRHACSRQSYKTMSESLQKTKDELEELNAKNVLLIEARDRLRKRIQGGEFSLEGLKIPETRDLY